MSLLLKHFHDMYSGRNKNRQDVHWLGRKLKASVSSHSFVSCTEIGAKGMEFIDAIRSGRSHLLLNCRLQIHIHDHFTEAYISGWQWRLDGKEHASEELIAVTDNEVTVSMMLKRRCHAEAHR
jgi:hypothetical protein